MMEDSAWYFHPNESLKSKGIYVRGQYARAWKYFYEKWKIRADNYRTKNGLPEGGTLFIMRKVI